MALYLVNHTKTPVQFEQKTAAALSYPSLPGSRLLSFQTPFIQLMVKELIADLFTIRYNVFRFSKSQAIEAVSHKAGIHSRVMLQGDLRYDISEIGHLHQREDSVSMIWSEEAQCTALFEGGQEYRALDIHVAPVLWEQLSFFFPDARLHWQNEKSRLLLPQPCFITPAVKDIINDILDCPYDEQTSRFYFDLKVREYFYVLLEQCMRMKKSRYRYTPYDAEQIYKAREILLANLGKPPHTIRALAKMVGLNEDKLKAGFKHFFGVAVFEAFQHARMEKARDLLLHTNEPIKAIASLTGYLRTTNFITAFRKYFGYTPASLRRDR